MCCFCNFLVVIHGKAYKWVNLGMVMAHRWHLLLVIALFFLSGCAVSQTEQPSPEFITVEVDSGDVEGTYSMQTFEISEEKEDLFEKWQAYNEQRMNDDKWDAFVDETKHELAIDADISDDWIDCDREVFVDVEIENKGDVDEDEVIVQLKNEALGVDEVEAVDIAHGYFGVARFALDLKKAARGDYTLDVRVFRDGDVDEFGTDSFSGESEGRDSVELFVANCVG